MPILHVSHWTSLHREFDPGQNVRTTQLQSSIPLLRSNDKEMLNCNWLVLTFRFRSNPRCKLGHYPILALHWGYISEYFPM